MRVQLATDALWEFARLDSLQIEIAPLLADRVVGEIVLAAEPHPQGGQVRVPAGAKTPFTYDLGVEFASADRIGCDAVRISAPAEATFRYLEMGDPLSAVEPDSLLREASGFVVFLPRPLHPSGDQRLRIGLEAVLYGEAGEFGGEVFNRHEPSLLQRVEGGDVSAELGSNQLLVVASAASSGGVLGDIEAGNGAFTPQGDGINDLLSIQYTLFRVRESSQVQVGLYALDGRPVWQAPPSVQGAGRHAVHWDGRDAAGQLVRPGVYLARVEVETDQGRAVRLQPVAVIY